MRFPGAQLAIQAFLLCTFLNAVYSEQCEKLNATLWRPCIDVGFTHTFAIPFHVNRTELSLRFHAARSRHSSSQCLGETMDMMLCSFYVPQCEVKKEYRMVLPCKRVCAEYLYKCREILQQDELDLLTGPCNFLPDASPSSETCMEPKHFEPSPEARDILDGNCHEIIFPMCKKNYTHTILSSEAQKQIYSVFYNKNYNDSAKDDDNEEAPILYMEKSNSTSCKANLALILCSEFLPPCFSSEGGRSYYTVCRNTCKTLWDDCPDEYKVFHIDFFCDHLTEGDHPSGFCKNDRWPSEWRLEGLKMNLDIEKTSPLTKASPSYAWVAAAVLFPVVFVLLIIVAVYFWKRYRLKKAKGFEPKQLINEEDQREGEL